VSSHQNDIACDGSVCLSEANTHSKSLSLQDSSVIPDHISSSDTVAGQFSFLREGSETDGFNLIYLSQC